MRRTISLPSQPFERKLVLDQWLLGLFGVSKFSDLAEHLSDERLEGLDENNVHYFCHEIITRFRNLRGLSAERLYEYDENIVRHTIRMNERRLVSGEAPIIWKYFQYLSLLFTEIYLDTYFKDPQALLQALNRQIQAYNAENEGAGLTAFDPSADASAQLNKICFWNATGSGKTLIMHANILQYQFYIDHYGKRSDLNRVILLTPNEALSRQHAAELRAAGIPAELFSKDSRGLFQGQYVEILDIHKLKEEMGDKTVAVDAFESNNLVLVDEGHRGASSGETGAWMRFRARLCESGFSFEYSATFRQAVQANPVLTNQYARSIVIDYSYPRFHADGFGKNYQILNIDPDIQRESLHLYLVACLLCFFQQQRYYRDRRDALALFNVEAPLWVFVGGSVTKTLASRDAADIISILRFFDRFIGDANESIRFIAQALSEGLIASDGRDIFAGRFDYLKSLNLQPQELFRDIIALMFHAQHGGALRAENVVGAPGEIALRIGDNEPFGVINVGDDAKLMKLCESEGLQVGQRLFSRSLFDSINAPSSPINILIGSKKFTEGWNSWRVSTMGLMNVGATEGAQIIQLFGRGVRLKGFNFTLKRSSRVALPEGIIEPENLDILETLNVFGIRSTYMAQFRDFLAEEGLPTDPTPVTVIVPVVSNLGDKRLRVIRLPKTINGISTEDGEPFKTIGPLPVLQPVCDVPALQRYFEKNKISVNWYPKIQALQSQAESKLLWDSRNIGHLSGQHLSFIDFDAIYCELERFRNDRGWHNVTIPMGGLRNILVDSSWYDIYIPANLLAFESYENVRVWQDVSVALLKKYVARYSAVRKQEWEISHLRYTDIADDDPNMISNYRIVVDDAKREIVERLADLRRIVELRQSTPWEHSGAKAVWFAHHLYEPLLYQGQKLIDISPAPLNDGERQFVEDLKRFYDDTPEFFEGKELYLLRNLSRGHGVGFFEAGNFYPDFILWLIVGNTQFITFIDPKGIVRLAPTDAKVQFHLGIKKIQDRLGDKDVVLNSFILSNTPAQSMRQLWNMTKSEMRQRNILFQEDDRGTYIEDMLRQVCPLASAQSLSS